MTGSVDLLPDGGTACACPWYQRLWCYAHRTVPHRPDCRPATVCRRWYVRSCPPGYHFREEVYTSLRCTAPGMATWGACFDKTAYWGEECGYDGKVCVDSLVCGTTVCEDH